MKKKTLSFLLILLAVIPQLVLAQDEKKMTYGTPNYFRSYGKDGIGVFEATKADADKKFENMKIRLGAGFTQQFQGIKHSNATALNNTGTGANRLWKLTPGFMTSQANLFIDAELADGVLLNVTSYMSSRHHNEFWVKGGYIQFNKLPIKSKLLENLMKYTTIKVGHYEVNYGDAHFRRPDGGNTIQAPFMEGNIMDAFATEIGGEIMVQKNGLFGIVGVTNGMIKGHVDSTYKTTQDENVKRNPSIILKGGYDKQFTDKIRVRASGSLYTNSSQAGSGLTLYSGDRAGSNYQNVMEVERDATGAVKAYTAMYSSGRFNPGFTKKITAVMLNGFAKVYGVEVFGTYETAKGRSKTETAERTAKQLAIEGLYRFGANENFYAGVRYNKVDAELMFSGAKRDVSIERRTIGAGWFVTKNVLMKAEYVNQRYHDFPSADFRSGGKFKGYVIEAVVGF